jgi:hypothetical protein
VKDVWRARPGCAAGGGAGLLLTPAAARWYADRGLPTPGETRGGAAASAAATAGAALGIGAAGVPVGPGGSVLVPQHPGSHFSPSVMAAPGGVAGQHGLLLTPPLGMHRFDSNGSVLLFPSPPTATSASTGAALPPLPPGAAGNAAPASPASASLALLPSQATLLRSPSLLRIAAGAGNGGLTRLASTQQLSVLPSLSRVPTSLGPMQPLTGAVPLVSDSGAVHDFDGTAGGGSVRPGSALDVSMAASGLAVADGSSGSAVVSVSGNSDAAAGTGYVGAINGAAGGGVQLPSLAQLQQALAALTAAPGLANGGAASAAAAGEAHNGVAPAFSEGSAGWITRRRRRRGRRRRQLSADVDADADAQRAPAFCGRWWQWRGCLQRSSRRASVTASGGGAAAGPACRGALCRRSGVEAAQRSGRQRRRWRCRRR